MKVVALGSGTSQGIPVIGCKCATCNSSDPLDIRLRSSIYVETEQTKLLVDIGPDFRSQFLDNALTSVDQVLITHEHNDHVAGLDDIRAINFTQKKSVPFYMDKRVEQNIKKRYDYAFSNSNYPGTPQIDLNVIDDKPFQLQDILVTPINVLHGQLPIFGYRLNDLVYITDASQIPEVEFSKLNGVKVLIINALRQEKHYSHFTLEEAVSAAEKIGSERTFFTHISHTMGLTSVWSSGLPENVSPLQDKMIIEVK